MDATVLAAVIGAIATLGAAVVGLLLRRSDKGPTRSENTESADTQQGGPSTGVPNSNNTSREVLIVDDQAGDILWLFDWIRRRGYRIVLATNELAARKLLQEFAAGQRSFVLGLFDVMVAARDVFDLEGPEMDATFFQASRSTGVRLCQFVRHTLLVPATRLPLVCYSVRNDEDLLVSLKSLGVPFLSKHGGDFTGRLTRFLPKLETLESEGVSPNNADGAGGRTRRSSA